MALYVDRMARQHLQPGSVSADQLRREIAKRQKPTLASK
jgi:hypothetical protein